MSFLLNWAYEPTIDRKWLQERLAHTARRIAYAGGEPTGRTFPFTLEQLASQGQAPRIVLAQVLQLLQAALQRGATLVGHNVWGFDLPFLLAHFAKWVECGEDIEIAGASCIDTALLLRPCQCEWGVPLPGDREAFWHALEAAPQPSRRWHLYDDCVPCFCLADKYELDLSRAQRADYDVYVSHLLLEELRLLGRQARADIAWGGSARPGGAACPGDHLQLTSHPVTWDVLDPHHVPV